MQLGISESARVTTAEEARFRIGYPNSKPRKSRIIALDAASLTALKSLAGQTWNGARFLRYIESKGATSSLKMLSVDAILEDVDGNRSSLVNEISDADVIVMVTSAGGSADAAEVIGNACFVRNKMTTGLVLNSASVSSEQLKHTLTTMRPFAAMLVVSTGDEYISEMLSALRV